MVWDFPHYHGSGWTPVELCVKALEAGIFFRRGTLRTHQIEQDPEEKIDLAKQEVAKLEELKIFKRMGS